MKFNSPPPRRWLVRRAADTLLMFILLCVACALPARAQQSSWTITYSGNVTIDGTPITPPPTSADGESNITATFTITYTWTGTGTKPTTVMVLKAGGAAWQCITAADAPAPSGSSSDGLDDPEVDVNFPIGVPATNNVYQGDGSGTWPKQLHVSGGIATDTVTLTAALKNGASGTVGFSLSASIAPPAIPINFRVTGHKANNATGVLDVDFAWDSSDGKLADLSNCTVYELVDFNSNKQGSYGTATDGTPIYILPSPPCSEYYNYANPTKTSKPATGGVAPDTYSPPSWLQPYAPAHWSGDQRFYFDDPTDGLYKISLFDAGSIDRDVTLIAGPSRYKYVVTHLSYQATLPSLP